MKIWTRHYFVLS